MICTKCLLLLPILSLATAVVKVDVSPEEIEVGNTENLTVSCSFRRMNSLELSTLLSLSLLHSSKTYEPDFRYIASVNIFDNLVQSFVDNVTNIKGAIRSMDESYLHVHWQYPKLDKVGIYKCEVTGFSLAGQLVTLSNGTVARLSRSDVDKITLENANLKSEMGILSTGLRNLKLSSAESERKLNRHLKSLTERLDILETRMKSCEEETSFLGKNTSLRIGKLQAHILNFTLEAEQSCLSKGAFSQEIDIVKSLLKNVLFNVSNSHEGKRYWLSKGYSPSPMNTSKAICHFFGGQLAQLQTVEESKFVAKFMQEINDKNQYERVLIDGQSNNLEFPCRCLGKDTNWTKRNCSCTNATNQFRSYLCEIPEPKK